MKSLEVEVLKNECETNAVKLRPVVIYMQSIRQGSKHARALCKCAHAHILWSAHNNNCHHSLFFWCLNTYYNNINAVLLQHEHVRLEIYIPDYYL